MIVWIFSYCGDKATHSHRTAVYRDCLNDCVSLDCIEKCCHKRSIAPFRSRVVHKCVHHISKGEQDGAAHSGGET